MKVTLWGTRGSLASPGPDTSRYGGNTSCVSVRDEQGTLLVLDAGSGIRRLGMVIPPDLRRVDILLTHLHLDHILGLGFFGPLFNPTMETHIWGPASITHTLQARLLRYLSPPLFPLHLTELSAGLHLHEVPCGACDIGDFHVESSLVCHPGPTVGYRITHANGSVLAYLPDHEPALGTPDFPGEPEWTSGYDVAREADLLIHDTQYTAHEYADREGWGHSTLDDALKFAELAEVREFASFHYDPGHNDDDLDVRIPEAVDRVQPHFKVTPGVEGHVFELNPRPRKKVRPVTTFDGSVGSGPG
jgi:ribonuclease BN (tRNA processing enzyme)